MKIINTPKAPKALGPYSQAIEVGGMLFLSGQIPLSASDNQLKVASIEEATHQIFDNITYVLKQAGASLDQVVKVNVFMSNLTEFDAMNIVYEERFNGHKPARSTVEVARLPKDVPLEIEVIAMKVDK